MIFSTKGGTGLKRKKILEGKKKVARKADKPMTGSRTGERAQTEEGLSNSVRNG